MSRKRRRQPKIEKVVDDAHTFRCRCGISAAIREEVYQNEDGEVVKYNLAFIHFGICQKDNGRVLGYDNSHGYHERHFMGSATGASFTDYETTASLFYDEVSKLKEEHEKADRRR